MKKHFYILLALFAGAFLVSCVEDDGLQPPPPPEPGEAELIHYWHFNELPGGTLTDPIASDFSYHGLSANITYPGTGEGYVDTRTHRDADPVSNFNLRMGQEPDQGAVLRLRNPAATREALIDAPTSGFEDLILMFATTRTENGSQEQQIEISADGGSNWTTITEPYYVPFIEEEGYLEMYLDLSQYTELNDNPHTRIRILFVGEGNDNDSGNNRLDNVSLDGVAIR